MTKLLGFVLIIAGIGYFLYLVWLTSRQAKENASLKVENELLKHENESLKMSKN